MSDRIPNSVKALLAELAVRPTKDRGQNFLINPGVIDQIVAFGCPAESDHIVEIGPGLGALTQALPCSASVTLIEIEAQFCEKLKAHFPHARVLNEDFRAVDLSTLGSMLTVFGNVPYSFSSEIVFHLLNHYRVISRAVLMLQREFAERIAAEPGGREYGILSVQVALLSDARLGPIIAGDSFHPPTEVESRLIELRFLPEPRVPVCDVFLFRSVVRAAFQQRRKKLSNTLAPAQFVPKDLLLACLVAAGIDPAARAETLTVSDFARLLEEFVRVNPSLLGGL